MEACLESQGLQVTSRQMSGVSAPQVKLLGGMDISSDMRFLEL